MDTQGRNVTQLLIAWRAGDRGAIDDLAPLLQRELRLIASRYMAGERVGHILQATALVNEAYLRLIDWKNVQWQNRSHFFGVAAQLMRRILVDYARSRLYDKRGGGVRAVSLDDAPPVADERCEVLLAIDEALDRLAALDARRAKVVELRYFGGLSVDETAETLGVSSITVIRQWNFAKAWLLRELAGHSTDAT